MTLGTTSLPAALAADIISCGYFPEMVSDAVALAVGAERVESHLVQVEATFLRDEMQRHLSVFIVTPTRFIVAHTDEEDVKGHGSQAITTTEAVALSRIRSVSLTQVVGRPEAYQRQATPSETWLTIGWGTMSHVEMEPAGCADPTCEADHGYSGTITSDDLSIRMSVAADGPERVTALIHFGTHLQQLAGAR
jgi:hypothetical protein